MSIHGINPHVSTTQTQPQQKAEASKTTNTTGISFGTVMDAIKKSMDGVMTVANKNSSSEAEMHKEKLEIEKQREFKTDLEEAHELLNKIAKLMGEQGKGKGSK